MSEPHKKKVEKLNQYLDSLPVHFDIPKVRPRGPSLCRLALFTLTHNTSAQTMRVIRCVACVRACVLRACECSVDSLTSGRPRLTLQVWSPLYISLASICTSQFTTQVNLICSRSRGGERLDSQLMQKERSYRHSNMWYVPGSCSTDRR